MLQIERLHKAYGAQTLLADASFSIGPNERIGLIGRNGHGKTTLLRILAGEEEADSGQLSSPDGYKVGYLSQHLDFTESSVLKEGARGLVSTNEGWEETFRVEAILTGLGFTEAQFAQTPDSLSGGFQVRLNLCKLLVSEPNLLLLDEPTNYLDILSLRWLIRFLRNWKGELVLVSHDQEFLNSVVTHTVGIHRSKIRKIQGGTEQYYQQILQDEEVYEQTRVNQERKKQDTEAFIDRFRAKATKARQVQSRIKLLEKEDSLTKLEEIKDLAFRFPAAPFPGKWVLKVHELGFSFASEDAPLFSNLSFSVAAKDRIAVVGKNGKGKTTLLRILAGELEAEKGELSPSSNLKLGYFGQTNIDRLNADLTVEEEIMGVEPDRSRGRARTICGRMMFEGDSALKQIKVLSGGERSRVLIGKLLASPSNFLLLDEPTNHLDMESTNAFCSAVADYAGAVLIVTHSEMLLKKLATRLIVFDAEEAFLFEGGYQDFLDRVGWKDEEQEKKNSSGREVLSKKQLRQKRGEIIERRSKALGPIKKQVSRVEAEIEKREAKIHSLTHEIVEASAQGSGEEISRMSQKLHENRIQVDVLYDKLEKHMTELETIAASFDEDLENLES